MLLCGLSVAAQQKGAPQVKINVLNVCAPSAAEQAQIGAALKRIPLAPKFAGDFEVARGRSTLPQGGGVARWVRIRRDLAQGPFENVQYSFSTDGKQSEEMLVFHARDSKKDDVMQVAVSDVLPAGDAAQALATAQEAHRVRLERFGASSLALARCPQADQRALGPLFAGASQVLTNYRAALKVRDTVPGDLARVK